LICARLQLLKDSFYEKDSVLKEFYKAEQPPEAGEGVGRGRARAAFVVSSIIFSVSLTLLFYVALMRPWLFVCHVGSGAAAYIIMTDKLGGVDSIELRGFIETNGKKEA
jgi:hypothetical protein